MGDKERAKLEILLDYWIKHNSEHGQEFREWAEKIGKLSETGKKLLEAAREMDRASRSLSQAQRSLKEKEP